MHDPPPCRHGSDSFLLGIDALPFNYAPVRTNIHLVGPQPSSALPEVATNPEDQDDRQGKVSLEECIGRRWITTQWVKSNGKLLQRD